MPKITIVIQDTDDGHVAIDYDASPMEQEHVTKPTGAMVLAVAVRKYIDVAMIKLDPKNTQKEKPQ
jgi:hypothetical protein